VASLFVIQGRDQGKRFELEPRVYTIGRESANDIQLHDHEVSRRHAELHAAEEGFELVDLESSNGCYVNSQRATRHELRSGDRLQLGQTLLIYTASEGESSEDLSRVIDIVGRGSPEENSRILSTVSHTEGSGILARGNTLSGAWLARARSNLEVMYRTALAVSHTLDIDQLLSRILELIFEWVESDRGCIMLRDEATGELTPKTRRTREGVRADERISISRSILDYVMDNKEGVLTSNAREDDRWETGASIVQMGIREAICVPMQGRYGIVGVIYIDTYTAPGPLLQKGRVNRFTKDHLKLMVAIGHQAALAVEDTSYYSAMVQAERLAAIGQTIAMLSHHIKNILQGIRGGSYLIEEGLNDQDAEIIRKGWSIVERNQEKISNLVMDMLSFSKEREPDMQPGDLNRVAAEVFELMQMRAQENEVELIWRPSAGPADLLFDADAMHRAILNVVTNAIDACARRPGAKVVMQTEYQLDKAVAKVVVQDNGEGVAPEDVKQIFNVFESRKGARGTGLGLPVSQKIMQEHSGDIHVQSSPGAGSRFELRLPITVADPMQETAYAPGETAQP